MKTTTESSKLEMVRVAVGRLKGKSELAEKVGCSANALHKFASGYTRNPGSEVIDAICRELALDFVTGTPLGLVPAEPTGRVFRGKLVPAKALQKLKPDILLLNSANTIDSESLPNEIDLSEAELRVILQARTGPRDLGLLKIRITSMGLHEHLANAIVNAIDGKYIRAAQMLLDFAEHAK